MKLGSLDIVPVMDGHMVYAEPPGFPPKDSPEFEPHSRYVAAGEFRVELGGFLVASGDRLVLIDAGLGPATSADGQFVPSGVPGAVEQYAAMLRGYGLAGEQLAEQVGAFERQRVRHGDLEQNLRTLGVDPAAVTDVVLTHLHPDHVGWTTKAGVPFFPNANVWCHQADVEHFLGAEAPDEAAHKAMMGVESTRLRLDPARGHFRVWQHDTAVAPGIDLRHLPGHTPGNAIAVISSGGECAYVLGDTVHCALELTDPDFHLGADMDPEAAHRSTDTIRREIEDGTIAVASPHFPGLRFGRLFLADGRRRWSWV